MQSLKSFLDLCRYPPGKNPRLASRYSCIVGVVGFSIGFGGIVITSLIPKTEVGPTFWPTIGAGIQGGAVCNRPIMAMLWPKRFRRR
jgi:hypothetical protein